MGGPYPAAGPPSVALPVGDRTGAAAEESGSRRAWAGAALFVALGIAAVGLLCGYNYVLTGDPLETPYHRLRTTDPPRPSGRQAPGPRPLPTIYEAGHTILRLNFWEFGWPLSLAFVPFFAASALAVRCLRARARSRCLCGHRHDHVYTLGPSITRRSRSWYGILSASGSRRRCETSAGGGAGSDWAGSWSRRRCRDRVLLLVFLPVQGASIR